MPDETAPQPADTPAIPDPIPPAVEPVHQDPPPLEAPEAPPLTTR